MNLQFLIIIFYPYYTISILFSTVNYPLPLPFPSHQKTAAKSNTLFSISRSHINLPLKSIHNVTIAGKAVPPDTFLQILPIDPLRRGKACVSPEKFLYATEMRP